MATHRALDIRGHEGQAIPNTLIIPDQAGDGLAVLYPGLGYTCDMPVFYYIQHALIARGVPTLRVEYQYQSDDRYQSRAPGDRGALIAADAIAALHAALDARPTHRLTVIGKSLGTIALAHVLSDARCPADATAIWLTPLLKQPQLVAAIDAHQGRSLIAIGTNDHDYDPELLARWKTGPRFHIVTIDDADHSFAIAGNIPRSALAAGTVAQAVAEFI